MIELTGATVRHVSDAETVVALNEVTVEAQEGELLVLFGPSGSGKSTLLSVIAGLQRLDDGVIVVDDQDVTAWDDEALARLRLTQVGVVFQDNNLIPEFTSSENVELPIRALGTPPTRARTEARQLLDLVGLGGLEDRMPVQLSGGQRQRVGIARALAGGRRILLADEPTGALDSENSTSVFRLLRQLADNGVTVVIASHDTSVRQYADRVVFLLDGRIIRVEDAVLA